MQLIVRPAQQFHLADFMRPVSLSALAVDAVPVVAVNSDTGADGLLDGRGYQAEPNAPSVGFSICVVHSCISAATSKFTASVI